MAPIKIQCRDWLQIRQTLSLSLLTGKRISIQNIKSFLNTNPQYLPVLDDFAELLGKCKIAKISLTNDNINITPGKIDYGEYRFKTSLYSSAIELLLLLSPSLSKLKFRTSIEISGVTHTGLSYPANFVNETLFTLIEELGFYFNVSLKKFGFYGSGGGIVTAKTFPKEKVNTLHLSDIALDKSDLKRISCRIFLSKFNTELAKKEKQFLCSSLNIPDENSSIIEVIDSRGYGNSMQVCLEYKKIPIILSKIIDAYDSGGEFIFNEEESFKQIEQLIKEVKHFQQSGRLPDFIIKELAPYLIFSGADITDIKDANEDINELININETILKGLII